MTLSANQNGKIGEVFTEAIVEFGREMILRNQIKNHAWSKTTGSIGDAEPPIVYVPTKGQWDTTTLTGLVLWEYEGLTGSYAGTGDDATLAAALTNELENRIRVRDQFQDAVMQYYTTAATTDFYNDPVKVFVDGAANGDASTTLLDATGNALTTENDVRGKLQIILHMFGRDATDDDRPAQKAHRYYSSNTDVGAEVQRRVQELAAGTWDEHKNHGNRFKNNPGMTTRNGFYCGCG